jgi:hypothetical protein
MPEMVWSFVGSLTRRGSPFVGPANPMPIQRLATRLHLPQIDASRQYAHKGKWIGLSFVGIQWHLKHTIEDSELREVPFPA